MSGVGPHVRACLQAIDSKLFSVAPTLNTRAQIQRIFTTNMRGLSSEPTDICSVVAVTPENNVATVDMLMNFSDARSCS